MHNLQTFPNPFESSFPQVIFLQTRAHSPSLDFVERHYKQLEDIFAKRDYELTSLPLLLKQWQANSDTPELLSFHYPALYSVKGNLNLSILGSTEVMEVLSKFLLYQYSIQVESFSGFFLFHGREVTLINCNFSVENSLKELDSLLEKRVGRFLEYHFEPEDCAIGIGRPDNSDSISEWVKKNNETEDLADELFPIEAHQLAFEIVERLEKLKRAGFEKILLESLSQLTLKSGMPLDENSSDLSTLTITGDYRILLTDYGNLEVELTPLPKVVFLFFLRHPEGVLFKRLFEHRDELLELYKEISLREDLSAMHRSIDELVDPTKNSINEKCSRIKEAFVKIMDESYAQHYYITGQRGEEKRIAIQRDMVIWARDIGIGMAMAKSIEELYDNKEWEKVMIAKAKKLRENHSGSQAISLLNRVIDYNPYSERAFLNRGIAYFDQQDYSRAIDDYSRAIEINDLYGMAYFNRALAFLTVKDYEKALEDLNANINLIEEKDGYYAKVLFLRGMAYRKLGHTQLAIADYRVAESKGYEDAAEALRGFSPL